MGKSLKFTNDILIMVVFSEELLDTLNLSNQKLKKLNKPSPSESQVKTLILDENELQRLDNIDSFTKLEKVLFKNSFQITKCINIMTLV